MNRWKASISSAEMLELPETYRSINECLYGRYLVSNYYC